MKDARATKIIDKPKTDKRVLIKINNLLDELNKDYSYIARGLGFEPEYGGPLMRGKRKLSVNQLIKIAEILGVEPGSLLPGENPTPKSDLVDFFWDSIEERLSKYFEEKFKEFESKK